MLIIIAALKAELSDIISLMNIRKKNCIDGILLYQGNLNNMDTLVTITGMGRDSALRAVDIIFSQNPSICSGDSKVLITGFCGAVDNTLKAGEPVIYNKVINIAGRKEKNLDKGTYLSHQLSLPENKPAEEIKTVTCGCIDHVAIGPEEKKDLFNKHCIDVIDMESYWLVGSFKKNGFKSHQIFCIRAVSDDSIERLPSYFSACTTKETLMGFLKSFFISMFSRDEFNANRNALINLRKAKKKLGRIIPVYIKYFLKSLAI